MSRPLPTILFAVIFADIEPDSSVSISILSIPEGAAGFVVTIAVNNNNNDAKTMTGRCCIILKTLYSPRLKWVFYFFVLVLILITLARVIIYCLVLFSHLDIFSSGERPDGEKETGLLGNED
jgi:hypothetical protein